ncbi:MAG: DUF547 domain-containing protein [Vicinamibacterales bacterium]
MRVTLRTVALVALVVAVTTIAAGRAPLYGAPAQEPPPVAVDPLHRPFEQILDIYVRDGLVYYQALKQERGRFDGYVRALAAVTADTVGTWAKPRQLAYWINAYNAFVLQTVIDHYPIRGKSAAFPANSIRQIPGAFERQTFRAGGRTLTLDALERDVIAGLGDPRALLALGRGAIGSGRLKSEAYTEARLDAQLGEMAREIVTRREMVEVRAGDNELSVSAMFSWREAAFSRLADRAPAIYAQRSPLERALLALIEPVIVPNEAEFLRKNQFRMVFHDFDWKLNDLTGRGR